MTRLFALSLVAAAGCSLLYPLDYRAAPPDATLDLPAPDASPDAPAVDAPADASQPACPAGFDRCAGASCTDIRTNTSHCGRCGNVCALANATPTCEAGACAVASCNPGYADCNADPADGCETNTSTSVARCGRCDNACPTAGGAPVCRDGVCRVGMCGEGFADCDGSDANGCETDTRASLPHCGACRQACARPNAAARCEAGACGVASCNAGFGDCDNDPANGCETNTATSAAHCGACGRPCASAGGVASCGGGACSIRCDAGFADCDSSAANGCETDTRGAFSHCGACNRPCLAGQSCAAGVCGAGCAAGETSCSGTCVHTRTSAAHCGACGRACTAAPAHAAPSCADGLCGFACLPGFGNCNLDPSDGCEAPLDTPLNCGACMRACPAPPGTASVCAGGACASSCLSGQGDCDEEPDNGCETSLLTTAASCGACRRACAVANATPACRNGACAVGACNAGFGDCNGTPADGCEVSTSTALAHCGRCSRACALPNATPACIGGECRVMACNAGFGDCDGNAANGCEVNFASTAAHCGRCGNQCAGACVGSECCGATGQTCCRGATPCTAPGATCSLSTCRVPCGGNGQVCCAMRICGLGLVCRGDNSTDPVCRPCGARGQPCCPLTACGLTRCNPSTQLCE